MTMSEDLPSPHPEEDKSYEDYHKNIYMKDSFSIYLS